MFCYMTCELYTNAETHQIQASHSQIVKCAKRNVSFGVTNVTSCKHLETSASYTYIAVSK